jgi:predicted DNA-binding transcriptional regulator AlpA
MAIRNFNDLPEVFDVDTLQEIMDISRSSAYALVNRSDFPKMRVGKSIKIFKSPFIAWSNEQTKPVSH